jgi:RNA polymerase sigma-B factor
VLIGAFVRTGDLAARERLIEGYLPLVRMLARRFANRGEQLEDLVQVGTVGLIAAIDRFDSSRSVGFTTFAVPTIVGEIKRHLRDHTSTVRLPRRVQELAPSVRHHELKLSARLDRSPTLSEVAADMGVCEHDVREIITAGCSPISLSFGAAEGSGTESVADDLSVDVYETVENRLVLLASLRALTHRERCVLHLRFARELTQAEIADVLGISQVHVSRLIRGALDRLRELLADRGTPSRQLVGDAAFI